MMIVKTSRMLWCALMILSASATIAPSAHAQPLPCRYEVAAVIQAPPGPLTSSPTYGAAISPNGRYVVGWYNFNGFGNDRAYCYDMQTQQFTPLPLLPETIASRANDVNDAGQIVGTIAIPADKGFIFSMATGQYTLLEPIHPQGVCEVTGITSKGVVCGTRSIGSKSDPVSPKTAFVWTAINGFVDLGLIDGSSSFGMDIAEDGGVAVASGIAAYLWNGAQTTSVGILRGADGLTPNAIAKDGRIVGGALFINGPAFWSVPFDFRYGVLNALEVPNPQNNSCTAIGVNNAGFVVGGCRPIGGQTWRPFVWNEQGATDLNGLTNPVTAVVVDFGVSISESGTILCAARRNGNVVCAVLTPQPPVVGDTNCDEQIDVDDLVAVILRWGETNSPADVTHDGVVNVEDLILVIDNWTA